MRNKKFKKVEKLFVAFGFFFVAAMGFSTIYALNFLSASLIDVFSVEQPVSPPANFDIEGFKKLGF